MAKLGPNDLKQIALPSYWDAATLTQLQLATGETYEQWLSDVAAALSIANGQVLSDPALSGLCYVTEEAAVEYPVGVSNGFEAHTEYSRPDARRGATTGHMLGIEPWDRGLGWTWDFLRKARRVQLDSDISSAFADMRNLFPQKILTRLFKSTYTAVGSAGRSMPLADGGTADANYIPMARPDRGGTFLYTHDHIDEYNGIVQAAVEQAVADLWEHGHDAPYDILASLADVASWTATTTMTGFVPVGNNLVRWGSTQDLANVGNEYIGVITTNYGPARVRLTGHIPTTYWTAFKSYGQNDPRNPIWIRVGPQYGLGAVLLAGDHIREFPFENCLLFSEFGANIGPDRTAAVVMKNTSGSYSDPTIV